MADSSKYFKKLLGGHGVAGLCSVYEVKKQKDQEFKISLDL